MRIVHLSIGALPPPFVTSGGAVQRRVAELAREQARRGHDVTVLAPGATAGQKRIDGVAVHFFRCRFRAPFDHLEFQTRALLTARRLRPDVVHVHNEPEAGAVARRLGLRAVLSYDNYFFRGGRLHAVYRRALMGYAALLPVSGYCQQASTAYWQLGRTTVVANGVDVEHFVPDPAGAAAEEMDGSVVLYLGRVCRQKGSDLLLAAAPRLNARVVVAGPIGQFGGVVEPEVDWEQAMTDAGVVYLGRVADARLPGLLTRADVFVMPTRELEMQGMAALEALACGTPVVASDHGGLPETVPPDCGRLFAPGDVDDLVAQVNDLLADPGRRAAMGAAGRRHAETYAWHHIVDRLMPLYG